MRRLLLASVVLFLGLLTLPSLAWEPSEFPISYWWGPPAEANRLETWQTVREANFTVCGPRAGYSVEENRRLLDFCQQIGVKAIVTDSRLSWQVTAGDYWREGLAGVVKDYGSHPGLFGYYLQDEPNYRLFEPLGKLNQELLRLDPAHMAYINLFPTYASVEQLGTPTYREHLDHYMDTVRPAVLSYDHYCLRRDGSDTQDYFENLELIREAGLRHDTPAWNIILALPFPGYRRPSEGEMRWQVYTSLAYGVKGILYFTYWTDAGWEERGEVGIVDSDGKPGPLFPVIRQLNGEMRTLGKTLLGLTSTGVYHTGAIPQGCRRLGGDALVQVPQDVPLVVGFLRDGAGEQYAFIVNRNHSETATVSARFLPHVKAVRSVDPTTGAGTERALTNGRIDFELPPGDGRLLRLETSFRYPRPPRTLQAIDFGFDTDGDQEGWEGFNSLANPLVANGTFRLTFTGPDPYLSRSFLRVPADTYTVVRARVRLGSGSGTAQFFWATGAEPVFRDDKYLNFPVVCDGEFHECAIPVGEHAKWRGQSIRAIRLDPVTGGAERGSPLEIDWIRGE